MGKRPFGGGRWWATALTASALGHFGCDGSEPGAAPPSMTSGLAGKTSAGESAGGSSGRHAVGGKAGSTTSDGGSMQGARAGDGGASGAGDAGQVGTSGVAGEPGSGGSSGREGGGAAGGSGSGWSGAGGDDGQSGGEAGGGEASGGEAGSGMGGSSAGASGAGGTSAGVDPCYPSPCANHGACVANGSAFECRCAFGFSGDDCAANDGIAFVKMGTDAHACGILADGRLDCRGANDFGQSTPPPGTYQAVALGTDVTCALRADGTVLCIGDELSGITSPPSGTFTQISVGYKTACGLRPDQTVECWGAVPGQTPPALPGTFTQIELKNGVCGVRASDGGISCDSTYISLGSFGAGPFKQVSNGFPTGCGLTATQQMVCRGQESFSYGNVATVSSGFTDSTEVCAVLSSTGVRCWGYDDGLPPLITWTYPGTYLDVSREEDRVCALTTGGTLACWDYDRQTPQAATGTFVDVQPNANFPCGLRSDGSVSCPINPFSERTDPGPYSKISPQPYYCALDLDGHVVATRPQADYTPPGVFTDISCIYVDRRCGIDDAGTLRCWDDDVEWEPLSGTFVRVSVSMKNACAIATDGAIECWGSNSFGQSTPPDGAFVELSVGPNHACAIRASGALACWGNDEWGQATPPGGRFERVSVSGGHSCAVRDDGRLKCWGSNNGGQSAPPEGTFTRVAAGDQHTCALDEDGVMICFGEHRASYGMLSQ